MTIGERFRIWLYQRSAQYVFDLATAIPTLPRWERRRGADGRDHLHPVGPDGRLLLGADSMWSTSTRLESACDESHGGVPGFDPREPCTECALKVRPQLRALGVLPCRS